MSDESMLDLISPTAPPPCMGGCEPRFADLTAAVTSVRVALDDQENVLAQIQHDIRAIATAINTVGELTESHHTALTEIVTVVRGFATSMNGMNPATLIKGLLGGNRG